MDRDDFLRLQHEAEAETAEDKQFISEVAAAQQQLAIAEAELAKVEQLLAVTTR